MKDMTSGVKEYDMTAVNVLDLLPQQPPFVMVDRMVAFDPIVTATTLTVAADNLFCEEGCLSPYGLIENVAQTCAARIGYINSTSGEPIRLGFIGAIRQLVISRLPKVGETIITTIHVDEEVFSMTLVSATVCVGDECIMSCEMKIALSNIDAA